VVAQPSLRYGAVVDEMTPHGIAPHRTDGIEDDSIGVQFRWCRIGDVHLDAQGKLAFPQATVDPGVYRFEVDADEAAVYFGEAEHLRKRFRRYRNADPTMTTNYRLRGDLTGALAGGGWCRVSVVEVVSFEARSFPTELDLRSKATRVLIESSAILLARTDGERKVLNLDRSCRSSL
jgi:hypothetical protein